MKNTMRQFRNIKWVTPKRFFTRFMLVSIFTAILTVVAQLIQITGGAIFKALGV